jgi:hypothetical protein
MGTRADFYVGRGEKAEWLGSVAWDGHPENFRAILKAKTETAFRKAVAKELKQRDDATLPADGWPWPWKDSHLTDYAYAFEGGATYLTEHVRNPEPCPNCEYGKAKAWLKTGKRYSRDEDGYLKSSHEGVCEFPSMTRRQAVAMPGSQRSGVMVLG